MESGLVETHLSGAELAQLLRDLGSRHDSRRTAARYRLAEATPEDLDRSLRIVDNRVRRIVQLEDHTKGAWLLYQFPSLFLRLLRDFGGAKLISPWVLSLLTWGNAVFVIGLLTAMGYKWLLEVRSRRAINEIAQIEDHRVLPPLVNALAFAKHGLRSNILRALRTRLPRISAADRNRFDACHQKLLIAELKKSAGDRYSADWSPGLSVSLLGAFRLIGDEEAIPAVQETAKKRPTQNTEPVINAARECLKVLTERQERERESRVLLRASDTPGESLLKPAGASDESGAALLVRPAGMIPGNDRVN